MEWLHITGVHEIDEIKEASHGVPCLIFKHSTRCSISSLAQHRLQDDWSFEAGDLRPYYLDLIQHRDISKYIADTFKVHHESPQVLLIKDGDCIYDASHLDIRVSELQEELEAA